MGDMLAIIAIMYFGTLLVGVLFYILKSEETIINY